MIKGTWQIVQWCPDLVTREWVNIGIGFKSGDFQWFKYLDDFRKVKTIYGGDTDEHLKGVLEIVSDLFAKRVYGFSPQIKLIEIGFSQGETVSEILNRSYQRVVTLRGGQ
ncbi:hypothetical protein [Acinetobacter puyangensis]|uniref:hypothetical protein n=1 Tax=Acinetobacter puyangensis TaxID=1096779 RepID=UPI003A4DFA4F